MVEIETKLSDHDLDLFAKRVLPIIRKFYEDTENQMEFEDWKARQNPDE